jgi:hypothetical protein
MPRKGPRDEARPAAAAAAGLLDTILLGGAVRGGLRVFCKCFALGFASRRLVSALSRDGGGGNQSAVSTGLFLGSMLGGFKALACAGLWLLPGEQYVRSVLFASALISGQALRLDNHGKAAAAASRHSLLASFAFVRSLWTLVAATVSSAPSYPSSSSSSSASSTDESLFPHADSSVFILCCTQIMWCWFYYPHLVSGVYRKWITRMAHMDDDLVVALRRLHHGTVRYGTPSDLLRAYTLRHGLDPERANLRHLVPQSYVHPATGNSTLLWLVLRFAIGVRDASLVYLPVHIIPFLLFKGPKLLEDPVSSTLKVARNVLQSSSFLGFFIALAWAPILLLRRVLRRDTSLGVFMGSLACGFAIFVERKSRRKEFAMFVAPRVLHIWFDALCERGLLTSWKGGSVWLFALSGAAWVQTIAVEKSSYWRSDDNDETAGEDLSMSRSDVASTSMAALLLG